jgi:hypothetical protein
LLAKDEYTKQFFAHVGGNGYDLSKLRLLWSHILQACAAEALPS